MATRVAPCVSPVQWLCIATELLQLVLEYEGGANTRGYFDRRSARGSKHTQRIGSLENVVLK